METASIVVLETTSDDLKRLESIATALVERRWVACAQILGPHRSYYRWEGAMVSSEEYKLQVKTTAAMVDDVVGHIRELHNYELPELARYARDFSSDYAQWVESEIAPGNGS